MKYVLTISTDDPMDIVRLMSSGATLTAPLMQAGQVVTFPGGGAAFTVADDDGDDNAPANTAAPAFDSAGLPWDARIHSASKATVKDGTWRKVRNADAATVATVEAELRARTTPPHVAGAGMIPPAPMTAPPPAMPPMPPAPAAMITPPAPPAAAGMPFGDFMQRLQIAIQPGGTLSQADLQAYQNAFGIADLNPLATDPEKCLSFYNYLKTNGKIG